MLNAVGGYDITGISGTVNGNPSPDAITGLIANLSQPFIGSCCGFNYDNVLFALGPRTFDTGGVLFSTVSGNYNLWMNSDTDAQLYTYGAPGGLDVHGTLSATLAVPEPATWGLMILGFGAAGAALRTRRRQLA